MDRPEDFQPNPITGTVFTVLTNNIERRKDQIDAANPRADNKFGHIVELIPPGGRGIEADHTADTFRWDMFIRCGDPSKPEHNAFYPTPVTQDGWFVTPDNIAFDAKGRLWIATDGADGAAGFADGAWACEVEGSERGKTRHFFSVPIGAEMCGPTFTPDDSALFLSVQHPGAAKHSTFQEPITRWPDFVNGMPPRPSVVVVTRDEGGPIS
jgi:secreted PhoX family phosphatase